MKARMMIGTVAIGLLSMVTVAGRAQAIAVGADGTMQQEKIGSGSCAGESGDAGADSEAI